MHYRVCRVVGLSMLGAIALTATIGIIVLSMNHDEIPSTMVGIVAACISAIAALVPTINQVAHKERPYRVAKPKPPVQVPPK